MPRKPRIHVPGAFYHVTLRGNHRQDIFFCREHRRWLDEIVADAIERSSAQVHAYCWMTNHIHLIAQVGDVPLGRLMLRIASQYARRVQSHMITTGHLFERRYHALLVDADEYLLTLIRYIHLNPVRAKLVATPYEYEWSSHRAYSGITPSSWVTTDFALSLLHVDQQRARWLYGCLVNEEITHTVQPFAELNPNDRRILGSDVFTANIHGLAWQPKSRQTMDDMIAAACKQHGVLETDLHSRSTRRQLAKARAWVAQQCMIRRIASISQVARRFGRDESTLRESILRYFPPR